MLRLLWKALGQSAFCGAAFLSVVSLAQGQGLPSAPPGADIPMIPVAAPSAAPPSAAPGLGEPLSTAAPASAPQQGQPNSEDLRARIERLEKMNQDLMDSLKKIQASPTATSTSDASQSSGPNPTLSPQDVRQIVTGYMAEQDAARQQQDKARASEGYKVGSDLTMKASWQNGVVFETAQKDFWFHAGVRVQYDNVFFHESRTAIKAPPIGVGEEIDGNYWRRIRPNFNGGFWEIGEFNAEFKLEIIQNGVVGMDDVWVGVKDIPIVGTVRVGHFHLPHGFEADMYSSSKPMTFFEVYSGNAAFYSGERCGTGIWLTNAFLDQRVTYAADLYHPENDDNGEQFTNGAYAAVGRLSALPLWSEDGRCYMHLGGSATWRKAVINGTPGLVDFGTDLQMRDRAGGDNGYGGGTAVTTTTTVAGATPKAPAKTVTAASTSTLKNFAAAPGNNNRWVDTGSMLADSSSIFGLEFLYNMGPFSVQSEYHFAYANGARGVLANGVTGAPAKLFNEQNLGFTGGYVQVGYFLTGESRQYDKRLGRLNSEYISRPNTPFWFLKGEDGKLNYGLGAWEVAARYSHLDLNSGPIQGGILDQFELGVNWHLNNNLRVQFMYIHGERYDMSPTAQSGWMNGFGVRTQFTF